MDVSLTSSGIPMICNGQVEDFKPILQVIDIKLLSAGGNQNNAERYRMLLSDGVYMQQGMLSTTMNHLVYANKLQKGSIVELSQFVPQVIQDRKLIIIIEMNVIFERYDQIGEPVLFGKVAGGNAPQPSPDHSRSPQSYGGPTAVASPQTGALHAPNVAGQAAPHNSRLDPGSNAQSNRNSFIGNPDSRGFSTTNGPMHQASATVVRSYNDQNRYSASSRQEGGGPRAPYNTHVQPIYQQPPMNRGPIAKNDALPRVMPIAALNLYNNKWAIKARVTTKSDLRHYTNSRGEGKVFSFDVLDSDGGEIQVTCFNAVADQFYNMIEKGRVYVISTGSVRTAAKKYNHLNNEFTIHLESTSIVELCPEDDAFIPKQQFNFRPISDIEGMKNDSMLDLIGVVSSVFPTTSIRKKDGHDTLKKSLQLKDKSGRSVDLTLWGDFCNEEGQEVQVLVDSGVFPVLAVKGGRVSDFNGKSVGTLSSSQLFINPDFVDTISLRQWFEAEGKSTPCVSISRDTLGLRAADRKTVSQIKDDKLGTTPEKADWISVKGKVSYIKADNFCYTACPKTGCNKKVTNNGDGRWQCDKCDGYYAECDYRYILAFHIQDHTGTTWVTAFQESAEEMMGVSAKELYVLKHEDHDEDKFGEIFKRVLFTEYLFKLKVKEETYSDEARIKSTAVKVEKTDFLSASRFLLDLIDRSVADPNAILFGRVKQEASNSDYGGGRNMNINASYGGGQYGGNARPQPAAAAAAYYNNSDIGVSVVCGTCGIPGHSSKDCARGGNRQMGPAYGPPPTVGVGYGYGGVSNHRVV